jgi:hypothetical protein
MSPKQGVNKPAAKAAAQSKTIMYVSIDFYNSTSLIYPHFL